MTVSELLPAKPLAVTRSPVEMNTTHKPLKIQGFADPVIIGAICGNHRGGHKRRWKDGYLAKDRYACYTLCTFFDDFIIK